MAVYYFNPATRSCVPVVATGVKAMDIYSGNANSCVVDGDYSNGTGCCAPGKIWDSTTDN